MTIVTKAKTINQMRDKMLEAFDKLANGEMDLAQAGSLAKMCDSVVGTFKLQMDYAKMIGAVPNLPFIATETLLEHKKQDLLGDE